MMGNAPSPCARHERYDLIVRRLHNAYWWQQVFVHIVWGTKSAEESQVGSHPNGQSQSFVDHAGSPDGRL